MNRSRETLSTEEARAFYDRFGTKQDRQTFYEDRPLEVIVEHGRFREAHVVLEFGCGTGRFAKFLLENEISPNASYHGLDISETMVRLASERLVRFGPRASVTLTHGRTIPEKDASVDRFLSTYVLDLLPPDGVSDVLGEAQRILRPGGLLCAAGITWGTDSISRLVMHAWDRLFTLNPSWVGGCRPTNLTSSLSKAQWSVVHREVVVAWGIASEVLVASRTAS